MRRLSPMFGLAIIGLCGSVAAQDSLKFNPRVVVRRSFKAIRDAPFVTADKIGDAVADNELVIGIVVEDTPRAYPLNMLTGPRREIINDTVAGTHLAATW